MSTYARKVLNDCKLALGELTRSIDKGSKDLARIRWFTCIAMLRAVGHVLHKKDQKNLEASQKKVAKDLFIKWRAEPIFSEFIEQERNLILKQYESSIDEVEREEEFYIVTEDGYRITTEDGDAIVGSDLVKNIEKVAGFAAGATSPQVISHAIEWWENALDDFDNKIKNA